jgi:hypothetical protein
MKAENTQYVVENLIVFILHPSAFILVFNSFRLQNRRAFARNHSSASVR